MNAIVFHSNAGHTERLARAVAGALALPIYTLKEAKRAHICGDGILYFGWILGGKIQGIEKIARLCRPAAVIAVGMSTPTDELREQLKEGNLLGKVPFLYVQGGFEQDKLHGIFKLMIRTALRQAQKDGEPADFTEEERKMRRMLTDGCDFIGDDARDYVLGFLAAVEAGQSCSSAEEQQDNTVEKE